MKNITKKLIAFMLLTSIANAVTINSMSFQNAKLSDVIKAIAKIDNRSIMFGPKFQDRQVTINITKPINADILFNNILREYCLTSSVINGITVINSGKCQELQSLPPLSSLLNSKGVPTLSAKPVEKTETIILHGISIDQAKALIKDIKGIYSIYSADKLGVFVVSGSPEAIEKVNKRLKPYTFVAPRPGIAKISAPVYIYDINLENFEKLIRDFLSKDAVIVHEEGNKIIIEDYPKNIEDVLDYFPNYVSLHPKYITKVLFIKGNLKDAYEKAKKNCNAEVIESKEFEALVLKGSQKDVSICEQELSNYISEIPRESVIKSQTFYIKYITLDKFQQLIKPYLSDKAIVTPIKNMDVVTIIDYLQNLEDIKKHLKEYISTKPIYIKIEVKAIEINKQYERQLGLGVGGAYAGRGITTFNTSNFQSISGNFSLLPGASPSVTAGAVNPAGGLISGIYSEGKFHVLGFELQALESINKVRSVFKSTLLSMNGQPATLTQGIEYPFTTISAPGQAVPTVTLQNVLNSIKVTPQILPNGKILLNINLQNMSLGPTAANGQPTINQNSSSLSIVLSNGSTIAIGGINLENKANTLQGIPGLDKVPVIGNIGTSKTDTSNNTNLFIFITAKRVER